MIKFEKQCKGKTPFFSLTHDEELPRPSALHVAILFGYEGLVKFLVDQRADTGLKCWFGDVVGMCDCVSCVFNQNRCGF